MKEGLTIFVICYLVLIVSDSEGRVDFVCHLLPSFDSFQTAKEGLTIFVICNLCLIVSKQQRKVGQYLAFATLI